VSLEAQYLTMVAMTVSGAVMGAIYDMYRTVLKEWRLIKVFGPLFDLVFWILSIVIVFSSLLWANHGDMRIYVFVILCIGYLIYKLTLQRIIVASTMTIIQIIQFTVRSLYRMIILLIVRPIVGIYHMLLLVLRLISRIGFVLEQVILWPFQILLKLLGWLFRPFLNYGKKKFQKPYQKLEGFFRRLSNWLQNKE
jgi:spore cortex biosynthesis protein YabQ